ncbi:MAG: DMT family transporter, partial [Anaerolineales bacterium]
NIGCLLLFLNAVSYGLHLVILKPITKKYSSLTIVKWNFIYGCIMVIPFGYREIIMVQWHAIPDTVWMSILFVIICATILTYLLTMWAIQFVNASVVGIYSYVQPFLASIIAISLGKDTLTSSKVIIGFFIFAGVYLVSYTDKKDESEIISENEIEIKGVLPDEAS